MNVDLTRDNMTEAEMAADDAIWAGWFQDRSWEAIKASQKQRPAMKARIDFMAKQRIIGMSFPVAEKAFAKAGGAA